MQHAWDGMESIHNFNGETWREPLGTRKCRFENNTEMDLKETRTGGMDLIHSVKNSVQWLWTRYWTFSFHEVANLVTSCEPTSIQDLRSTKFISITIRNWILSTVHTLTKPSPPTLRQAMRAALKRMRVLTGVVEVYEHAINCVRYVHVKALIFISLWHLKHVLSSYSSSHMYKPRLY